MSSAPQPKPEPTGKEWEGESRFHAFHSFHFQKGDGRRGRRFGARLSRDADEEVPLSRSIRSPGEPLPGKRPLLEKVPVRLSRSLSVISATDLPEPRKTFFRVQSEEETAQAFSEPVYSDPLGTVCLPVAIFTASILSLLFLLLLSSTVALVLYIRQRDSHKKHMAAWLGH